MKINTVVLGEMQNKNLVEFAENILINMQTHSRSFTWRQQIHHFAIFANKSLFTIYQISIYLYFF